MDSRLLPVLHAHYGLENVQVVQKFDTSGRREAYLLRTAQGLLVLKLTDPGRPENIVQGDTGILATLARHGFPAPLPVYTREKRLYLPFGERFFYLYQFIEGKKPTPSAALLEECGRLLARLHTLPLDDSARPSLHRPPLLLEELRGWLDAVPHTPEQQGMSREILAMIAAFPSFEGLPEALIHTDPYFVNLLEGGDGRLYLIDWEDAGISYPLIDAGYLGHLVTYLPGDRLKLGLAGDEAITFQPAWARAFLDGYQSVRRFTREEQALFPYAVRLNFLMYIWDWDARRIIPENYRRMKLMEGFRPIWR